MKKHYLCSLMLAFLTLALSGCTTPPAKGEYAESEFTTIFNGKDFDGWYLKMISPDQELAKKVYAIEDGTVHVFNDEFPNFYDKGNKNTFGLFYTQKKYNRYILRFEYKWGEKLTNTYENVQYDAGCFYHVTNDKIWPDGIEYQIRYNHITNTNHTGDYWVGPKTRFDWCSDGDGNFLMQSKGGVPEPRRSGEHRASKDAKFNALNDEWNKCEIIVMGDKYSIHKLNGEIVNMATNLGFTEGIIGFQSESAEIFYRNIRIKEFTEDVPMDDFI